MFFTPLAAQAQNLSAGRSLGNRHCHPAADGRHLDARAENGLVQGNRQFKRDIVAIAREQGMGLNLELDERVARLAPACARTALVPQPKRLPALDACGNGNIERLVVGKLHALLYAVDRLQEADLEVIAVVHAAHGERAALPSPPEKIAENIGKIARSPAAAKPAAGVFLAEALPAARIFAMERVRALISHRVDLARVITLALLGVAQHGKGGRNFFELLLGLFIVFILVGMQIFRELPVGPADLVVRGRAFNTQYGVQIFIHGTWSD